MVNRDIRSSFIPNTFRYQKIPETKKGAPAKIFGTLRLINLTENRDTPSLPSTFPIQKHFWIPGFLWTTGGFLYGFSALRDKTGAAENRDITLLSINFLTPEISESLKCSFTKCFGNARQKISTENLETPSFPLIHNFFWYQNFCKTQKGSRTKSSVTVRQQIFYEKSWTFPSWA